jgi:hypothetical protein
MTIFIATEGALKLIAAKYGPSSICAAWQPPNEEAVT